MKYVYASMLILWNLVSIQCFALDGDDSESVTVESDCLPTDDECSLKQDLSALVKAVDSPFVNGSTEIGVFNGKRYTFALERGVLLIYIEDATLGKDPNPQILMDSNAFPR
jgi:hypothetical protein